MTFFRDYFAAMLNNPYVRVSILFGFFIYLSVAILGVLQLEEGLERRRLARFDSYSVQFYDLEDTYFREYPYRISVSILLDGTFPGANFPIIIPTGGAQWSSKLLFVGNSIGHRINHAAF